ncbi:MAG: TIGR02281 family clan AA aspartic protease [Sphingomonadales bacterium]|nr:TIGR02281 family clan AA aspartic protease [Sphingomonadales bacterium]MDE2569852.1 TIGR02281 family clan AA aspartic protease [Sphingomonadales bacterium]
MNRLVVISLVTVLLLLGLGQVFGETHPLTSARPASAASAGANGAYAMSGGGDAIGIARGPDGQFHMTAQVNGGDTSFLVDTGADMVALTVDEADRLGIFVDRSSFQPILRTASGTGYGQRVRLDSVEIGGRELTDVDAVVVQGLQTNLLGQSVLRQLGRVELRGDRLVIEPA